MSFFNESYMVPPAIASGGTAGPSYVQTSSTPAEGIGVPWVYNVKDGAYGAKGDGVTDDTAAIQAAINACSGPVGGIVFLPPGTYVVNGLALDQRYGVHLMGAGPAMQYQTGPTTLLFTQATGHLLTMYSTTNCEVSNIQFHYNNASFTGDLIDIDGSVHASDCQNNHIHHCSSKDLNSRTARSIIRLNQTVINQIDHCAITGAGGSGIRVGDPGGTYVNVQVIEECSFNFNNGGHIFVGSADCESLTVRANTFEGAYCAIYGAETTRDGGQNECYNPVIENNWAGDGGSQNWIDGLTIESDADVGTIQGNLFWSAVNHLIIRGRWNVLGNTFLGGTVYTCPAGVTNVLDLVAINNFYNSPTHLFDATTFPQGQPLVYVSIGNSGADDIFTNKLGFRAVSASISPSTTGDLILGARANAGWETPMTSGLIYKGPSPNPAGTSSLMLQAPWTGSVGDVLLGAGPQPTPTVWAAGTSTFPRLSFYGVTPVFQPTATAVTAGYTAGTSTAVTIDGKVSGNVGLPAPTAAVAAVASGGTFAAGTYYWKVSATNAAGETLPSAEVSATLVLDGSATITWAVIPGATGYRVYRATVSGGESTTPAFVAAVSGGSVADYTDTGTAVSTGAVLASSTAITGYTLGDIVAALKNLGALAA